MVGLNDDLNRAVAEDFVGGAVRVEDIDGVGRKKQQKLRRKGFRNVTDIKEANPGDLTEISGIGESTATKMIRSAGGDPLENKRKDRTSSGSVSAAGIRMPVGDFKVGVTGQGNVEARFDSSLNRGVGRSQEAAQADKGKRAPITTDADEWKANKGRLDYPGVDTPSDSPEVMEQDRRFISPDDLIPDVADDFF